MRIKVLPREITDKIAAGEVVERPASVVKELMENALDAEAGCVRVSLGPEVVDHLEVVDDGTGMSPDEAVVSLRRHATSKISGEEDLYRIRTLGFRGEALSSIAAVAELEIETRTAAAPFGVRVSLVAGGEPVCRELGLPKGTRVIVRNLFQTTPARLKFLRSRQTELGLIMDTFVRLALSRGEVSFHLKRPGRPDLHVTHSGDLRQRAGNLFGWEFAEGLVPVTGGEGDTRVDGLLGAPGVHRATAREMYLFVNQRPVRDLTLQRAIRQAYGGTLERGRFPVAIFFLTLPCEEVDVNVHPTKLEVRFSRTDRVRDLVFRCVSQALDTQVWPGWPAPAAAGQRETLVAPPGQIESPSGMTSCFDRVAESGANRDLAQVREEPPHPGREPEGLGGEKLEPGQPWFARFRVLGQFQETYLVCEVQDRLVLIDQHAAHERIAFERLQEADARERLSRQVLLVPALVELPPREAECLGSRLELLLDCGLEVESYGGRTFVVKAIPALLGQADPGRLLRDLAGELAEMDRALSLENMRRQVFARMACHSVVRAGRPLAREEMESLLAALDSRPGLLHCPHGRPVLIAWSLQEIQKRFLRT